VDRLWEHTCFEVFLSAKGNSGYYEFNFAPSGDWAAYTFRGYRNPSSRPLVEDRSSKHEDLTPRIAVRSEGITLKVDAMIRPYHLPGIEPGARLRLALSAVVEDDRGLLSYWALKHAPGKPDFHHPDSFALELEPLAWQTAGGPSRVIGKR
ncbi:MAG TPA: DOMON-like domain-containing protein, partial [Candidatus Binatia bacterium]|nr:DOMON-like domain-containing protein [Candidatus Binatia bacterium]